MPTQRPSGFHQRSVTSVDLHPTLRSARPTEMGTRGEGGKAGLGPFATPHVRGNRAGGVGGYVPAGEEPRWLPAARGPASPLGRPTPFPLSSPMMNRRRALADPRRQAGTRQRLLLELGRSHLRCSRPPVPRRTPPSLVSLQLPRRPPSGGGSWSEKSLRLRAGHGGLCVRASAFDSKPWRAECG